MLSFKIENSIQRALGRAGVLSTPHGDIHTPTLAAVGTKGTVKSLTPEQIREAGTQVVLANTYHLHLEPGETIVKNSGGLHSFMNWKGPTMTDSGGFQAFSLGIAYGHGLGKFIHKDAPGPDVLKAGLSHVGKKAKVSEEGVEFVSILDGSKHFLSPEKSIQIQHDIGADIIFALDEFTSPHAAHDAIERTIERTTRWADRCLKVHKKDNSNQALFGIVQGGRHEDLRRKSAETIGQMDFDGFGIGGTFVKEDMATAVRWVNEVLPTGKPRHLLGVGEPIDLFLGVENGCDTFDCVAPTRTARNGTLYTKKGKIHILNAEYRGSMQPISDDCTCYTCRNYSIGYVAHLFRAKEMLGATLATIHNLFFLNTILARIRLSILEGTFFELKEEFFGRYNQEKSA